MGDVNIGRALVTAGQPSTPLDFNDHAGYVSLFDGVSLKGWDDRNFALILVNKAGRAVSSCRRVVGW